MLSSVTALMYRVFMAKKRRRRGKVSISAPPRISDGMMNGSSNNGLSVKRKLSSDYRNRRVGLGTTNIPLGPAIDADRFQFVAMLGLKHFSEHGDFTKLATLMLSLPSKRHQTLFATWCKRFARLIWDTEKRKFRWERGSREFDISGAEASPIGIGSRKQLPAVVPTNRGPRSPGNTARCTVCGATAMPGEDTCYGHMSG